MFVQVIQAQVTDPQALRQRWDAWEKELKAGAEGYLGGTGGIAEDGTFILSARFESEGAARKNSERPEQGEWWQETERSLEGPVFYDCKEVDEWKGGGSDTAGFVQVIQGYVNEKDQLRADMKKMSEMPDNRDDVIGGIVAWGPNDGFSQFVYFTSEEQARAGEAASSDEEWPPEAKEIWERWQANTRDVKYIDLKEPWFSAP